MASEVGDVGMDTPRDRDGTFEPRLDPKGARRIGGLDETIISLDAGGMTVRRTWPARSAPGDDPVRWTTAVALDSVEGVSVGVLVERLGVLSREADAPGVPRWRSPSTAGGQRSRAGSGAAGAAGGGVIPG